jgi:hypothetical protein
MTGAGAIRAGVAAGLALVIAAGLGYGQTATAPVPVSAGDQIRLRLHGGGTLTARLLAAGPDYLRVQPTLFTGNVPHGSGPTSLRIATADDTMGVEVHDALIRRVLFHSDAELSVPISSVRLLEVQRGYGRAEHRRPHWAFTYGVALPFGVLVPSAAVAGAACQCGATGRMTAAAAAASLAIGVGATLRESFRRGPRWVPGTTNHDDET